MRSPTSPGFRALCCLWSAGTLLLETQAQDATSTTNPLNDFINAAQSGASAIAAANTRSASASTTEASSSASSTPTSSSPLVATSPAAAASSSAAASGGGLSTGAKIGIIVGAIAAFLILLGIIIGLCCCCLRRRKRRARTVNHNELEKRPLGAPTVASATTGHHHEPMVYDGRKSVGEHSSSTPLMASNGAIPHGRQSQAPSLSSHPAMRDGHHDQHHFGRDAALVGAGGVAGGVAAHEIGNHHHQQEPIVRRSISPGYPIQNSAVRRSVSPGYPIQHQHRNSSGTRSIGARSASPGYQVHHYGHEGRRSTDRLSSHSSMTGSGDLLSHETQSQVPNLPYHSQTSGHHYGRDAALVGAGGLAAHEVGKHHHNSGSYDEPSRFDSTSGLLQQPLAGGIGRNPDSSSAAPSLGNTGPASGYANQRPVSGLNSHPAGGHDHHFGRDAALVGAGGLAGHEVSKHHNQSTGNNLPQHQTANLPGHHSEALLRSEPDTFSRQPAVTHSPAVGQTYQPQETYSPAYGSYNQPVPTRSHHQDTTGSCLPISTTSNHHYGRDSALVGAGGLAAHEVGRHHQHGQGTQEPFMSNPPTSSSAITRKAVGTTGAGAPFNETTGAVAAPEAERRRRRKSSGASRSRSNSRPASMVAGASSVNDKDRPPTPFGLNAFGQPNADAHPQVLHVDPPSDRQRRSLHEHEMASGELTPPPPIAGHQGRSGYSTPPEVPSRSPHRESRVPMSADVDNRYDSSHSTTTTTTTTTSGSGVEHYTTWNDPYAPANLHHRPGGPSSGTGWTQHTQTYQDTQGNFDHSSRAIPAAPPIPWQDEDPHSHAEYVQKARRNSHSPRHSMDASGRRNSRSPATRNGGKRLRFEDVQGQGAEGSQRQSRENPYGESSYQQARWSGVGEAL